MDKDKIRVGDYVRMLNGLIAKIVLKDVDEHFILDRYYAGGRHLTEIEVKNDIVKHNSNIIELIEKGDIVHTKDVLNEDYYYMYDDETIEATKRTIKDGITLVDILTHEQYKENCYRVKE